MCKTILAFSILALSLAATAKEIQQYSYGESWPFTVESGEIACYEQAVCSGQLNLATALESSQNRRSDSFGLNPAL